MRRRSFCANFHPKEWFAIKKLPISFGEVVVRAPQARNFLEIQTSQIGFFSEKSSRKRFPDTIFLKENPLWQEFCSKKFAPAARNKIFYLGLQIA
jgi:hypothetical protein